LTPFNEIVPIVQAETFELMSANVSPLMPLTVRPPSRTCVAASPAWMSALRSPPTAIVPTGPAVERIVAPSSQPAMLIASVVLTVPVTVTSVAKSPDMPGALVVDAGEESVAAVGIYPVTIAQVLPPGRYWLAVVSEATPGLHAFYHYYGFMFMGVKDESPSMSSAAPQGVYVAHAYGALPDPFGTPTEMWGSFPAVFLRFSSGPTLGAGAPSSARAATSQQTRRSALVPLRPLHFP
jgi:hypothetical protein